MLLRSTMRGENKVIFIVKRVNNQDSGNIFSAEIRSVLLIGNLDAK